MVRSWRIVSIIVFCGSLLLFILKAYGMLWPLVGYSKYMSTSFVWKQFVYALDEVTGTTATSITGMVVSVFIYGYGKSKLRKQ